MPTTWQWQSRDRRNFWDKARTIAQDYGEPVVRLLEVPGAFVPGVSKALEKLGALFGSDLNISELDSAEVLQQLEGAPDPLESVDGSSPVFIDGVRAAVTVSHNSTGQETILLERVDLCLIDYIAGRNDAYESALEAEEIFGAGFIEPMRFFVEVGKKGAGRARRSVRGSDGKTEMLVAAGPNFLDTDPGAFLALAPKDPPAMFRFTITAIDPGLYRLCLRWFYRVAAKELRQHTSLPILIYRSR